MPVTSPNHHKKLVAIFGVGLLTLVAGGAALLVSMLVGGHIITPVAAVLLALGSTTVAITLLRAQDLNERLG